MASEEAWNPDREPRGPRLHVVSDVDKRGNREGIIGDSPLFFQISDASGLIDALRDHRIIEGNPDRAFFNSQISDLLTDARSSKDQKTYLVLRKNKKGKVTASAGNFTVKKEGSVFGRVSDKPASDLVEIQIARPATEAKPKEVVHVHKVELKVPFIKPKEAAPVAPKFNDAAAEKVAKQSNSLSFTQNRLVDLQKDEGREKLVNEIVGNYVSAYFSEFRLEMNTPGAHPAETVIGINQRLKEKVGRTLDSGDVVKILEFFGISAPLAQTEGKKIKTDKAVEKLVRENFRASIDARIDAETAAVAKTATRESVSQESRYRVVDAGSELQELFTDVLGSHTEGLRRNVVNSNELFRLISMIDEVVPQPEGLDESSLQTLDARKHLLEDAIQNMEAAEQRSIFQAELKDAQDQLYSFMLRSGPEITGVHDSSDIVSGKIVNYKTKSGKLIHLELKDQDPDTNSVYSQLQSRVDLIPKLKSYRLRPRTSGLVKGATKTFTAVKGGVGRLLGRTQTEHPGTTAIDQSKRLSVEDLETAEKLLSNLAHLEARAVEIFDPNSIQIGVADLEKALEQLHLTDSIADRNEDQFNSSNNDFLILSETEKVDKVISLAKIEAYLKLKAEENDQLKLLKRLRIEIDKIVDRHSKPRIGNSKTEAARRLREKYPDSALMTEVIEIMVNASKNRHGSAIARYSETKQRLDNASINFGTANSPVNHAEATSIPLSPEETAKRADYQAVVKELISLANDDNEDEFDPELLGLEEVEDTDEENVVDEDDSDDESITDTDEAQDEIELANPQSDTLGSPSLVTPEDRVNEVIETQPQPRTLEDVILDMFGQEFIDKKNRAELTATDLTIALSEINQQYPLQTLGDSDQSAIMTWFSEGMGTLNNPTTLKSIQDHIGDLIIENETKENQKLTIENIVGDDIKNSHEAGTLTIIQIREAVRMLVERSGGTLKEDEKLIIRDWIKSGTSVVGRFDRLRMQINTLLSLPPELP